MLKTKENQTDSEIRTSKARAIRDPALFDLANRLVDHLSSSDDIMTYSLVRNDVTHIVYDTGGFFKPHHDYLSLTSNCVQVSTPLPRFP